jgi:MtN3 and saliva related transmembrane protein
MDTTQILGLIAGACTTAAFIPQVVKTWRTRSTKDLSLWMFSIFCLGVFLWLIYGFLRSDIPVIVANCITLMLASFLLVLKIKWKQ